MKISTNILVFFHFQQENVIDDLAEFLTKGMDSKEEEQSHNGCGIVYCRTRNDTVLLSRELRTRGISCKAYHAGLSVSNSKFLFRLS